MAEKNNVETKFLDVRGPLDKTVPAPRKIIIQNEENMENQERKKGRLKSVVGACG